MGTTDFLTDLTRFFKTARHLWGRCPHCHAPFRLSDAAISSSPEPPRDWLRRMERHRIALDSQQEKLEQWGSELEGSREEQEEHERDLRDREASLAGNARALANEMLKSDPVLNARIRDAKRKAVMQSRSTLLGKMLECIAPCFRQFGHDPRDMRGIFNPVDFVCFDGLTVDKAVQEVTFIEVKCATSAVSPVQRSLREAIKKRRVSWQEWRIGDPRIPITQQLSALQRRALPPAP